MTKLTTAQITLLQAIVDSEFQDGNDPVGNEVWTFSAVDGFPEASRGGILSMAKQAGLIRLFPAEDIVNGKRVDASTVTLTQAGWDALQAEIGGSK